MLTESIHARTVATATHTHEGYTYHFRLTCQNNELHLPYHLYVAIGDALPTLTALTVSASGAYAVANIPMDEWIMNH